MILNKLEQIKSTPIFFKLAGFINQAETYIKLDGLNIAHSIKLNSALFIIDSLEATKNAAPSKTTFVCSSSGNFALAASIVCKQRGYKLICVIDPNILPTNEKLLSLYGCEIIKVTEKDSNGGYLGTRIQTIRDLCSNNPNILWLDQYSNEDNVLAHYHTTAKEIHDEFKKLDYLVIGAGTTGTLMGCAKYFKEFSPKTKIIGVDSVGSVTFGGPPKRRKLPGLGTSRKPEIVNPELIDVLIMIEELDTINTCHNILNQYGLLLGASSGTVIAAVKQYQSNIPANSKIVCISPDFGERYIDTVYDADWIADNFPDAAEIGNISRVTTLK